jgi:hypothetical protein
MPALFPGWFGSMGFEQLSSSRPAQGGRGTGAGEADVPGHPPHQCRARQDQRSRQGHSGHDATLEGFDDGCLSDLYAVLWSRGCVRRSTRSMTSWWTTGQTKVDSILMACPHPTSPAQNGHTCQNPTGRRMAHLAPVFERPNGGLILIL